MLFSFSEYFWCSSIAFLWYESCYSRKYVVIVWMLFISEFLCYSRNVVFILWVFRWYISAVFSIILYIFYTVTSPFFWILLLFLECWLYALYVYVSSRMLLFCVCVCYSPRLCVIHWMFILFSECRSSRNIVVSWTFMLFSECMCYCHMLLLHFKRFYSLHICVFLGMIILFSECWYSPSVAAVLWMSVFCEYLCYALKFVLLSESFCCSLNGCVVILQSAKSLCYFIKRLLCLVYVSINVCSKGECYSIVNSEIWGSNPGPVYSSWWRFHKS